jgi:hypothetical protein
VSECVEVMIRGTTIPLTAGERREQRKWHSEMQCSGVVV